MKGGEIMAPEIRRNNVLIASVPDETGTHKTLQGGTVYVNVDRIDADSRKQIIILESDEIGGKRVLGLTQKGIGASNDPKRGDQLSPSITVSLLDKPIRVSYKRHEWAHSKSLGHPSGGRYREYKETHKNPRWIKGSKQR